MQDVRYGFCECGCGRETKVFRGRHRRFLQGHSGNKGGERDLTGAWLVDEVTGCWRWQRCIHKTGYAVVREGLAHRVVYELHRGPIPDGMTLDHLCRNRACVNPDHLEPVTHAENCRRGANAKITMATAREVKRLLAAAIPAPQIGRQLSITEKTVWNIKYGHSWKDA